MARGSQPNLDPEKVIEVLHKTHGLLTPAAEMLGCTYQALKQMAGRRPEIAKAIEDAKEKVLDFAESKLFEAIRNRESWAIKYFLSTQGKKRGYVERQELAGVKDLPVEFTLNLGK